MGKMILKSIVVGETVPDNRKINNTRALIR